jgi:hypothetical protein
MQRKAIWPASERKILDHPQPRLDYYLKGPPFPRFAPPNDYPPGDRRPGAYHSIYDRPDRRFGRFEPRRDDAYWYAIACAVCIRYGQKDIVLRPCIGYGFTRRNRRGRRIPGGGWGDAQGVGPVCLSFLFGIFGAALDGDPILRYKEGAQYVFEDCSMVPPLPPKRPPIEGDVPPARPPLERK